MDVAYVPTPLNSMAEICRKLNIGETKVREWVDAGAPITVEGKAGNTRYSTELSALLKWRFEYSKLRRSEETEIS